MTLSHVCLLNNDMLIAPGFFRSASSRPNLRWLMLGAAISAAPICLISGFRIEVAKRVVDKLPHVLQVPTQVGATVVMVSLAAAMVIAGLANLAEHRRDRVFLLLVLLALALDGTAIAVSHQFSSRYVLAAFPFALLAVQRWWHCDGWAVLRLGLGAAMGLASLSAYYWNEPPETPTSAPRILIPAAQSPAGPV